MCLDQSLRTIMIHCGWLWIGGGIITLKLKINRKPNLERCIWDKRRDFRANKEPTSILLATASPTPIKKFGKRRSHPNYNNGPQRFASILSFITACTSIYFCYRIDQFFLPMRLRIRSLGNPPQDKSMLEIMDRRTATSEAKAPGQTHNGERYLDLGSQT